MVNVALTGCGNWGRNLIRNFLEIEKANLEICYDKDTRVLEQIKSNYPEVKVTADYEKVLSNGQVDAVVIASSASSHYDLARKALKAGKHILVEKPLTLSLRQGEEIVSLAEKMKCKLMAGHILLYHPAVGEMKRRLLQNDLGEIFHLSSERLGSGRVRTVENVLWCLGVHDIYLALYLLDSKPYRIMAKGASYLQREKAIEDVVSLFLDFPGGIIFQILVSWLHPVKIQRMTIVGDKKMMVFDDTQPKDKLVIYNKRLIKNNNHTPEDFLIEDKGEERPLLGPAEPLRLECLHFLQCIEKNQDPLSSGQDILEVLRVLEAAQKSLKSGVAVSLCD